MELKIEKMTSFPENSNPYNHDLYHMGRDIGTDLMMMFANHSSEKMEYFILVNTKTGERTKVVIGE